MTYINELVQFINSKGKGVTMHICGKTEKIWDDVVDMGISGLSVDNVVNLRKCKEKVGNKVKIYGHVDPSAIMYAGTPAEVRRAVIECVQQAWDSPKGYVIMSGCSLPVETPFENIKSMLDTAREIGHPVNSKKLTMLLNQ